MTTLRNKKGFTLIELIVVIAILGVLALILVPQFMGYVDDADIQTQRSNTKAVYDAASASLAKTKTLKPDERTYKNYKKMVEKSLGESFYGSSSFTLDNNGTPASFPIGNGAEGGDTKIVNGAEITEVKFNGCIYTVSTNKYSGTCEDVTAS